ncbi:BnaC08g26560D [Brassica napus]|uniref:(rape) hypothetical protein n=1 Tax=Brassica napus TaxID=3708 RepID=A0A078HTM0_BRANA|nr:unnamed protein product [Brassica napus]CDY41202.1 BnaC08g26560D [Brassica napus]
METIKNLTKKYKKIGFQLFLKLWGSLCNLQILL